jgi:3-methyladenine DNA glycosylase AlkD
LTTERPIDVGAEIGSITAALKERIDPSYEWGMRRTVPSQQPAHAVRVPDIRRTASDWSRAHKEAAFDDLLALVEGLWASGWREERIVAIALLARSKAARAQLGWEVIERWSAGIDNWELVDNMALLLTGPMLVARPELQAQVEGFGSSDHVWQRRLAIVTLIEAARDDACWLPRLQAMTERLKGDRGPTMRKAVDWGRRTALKVEAKLG